ncbi:F-box/kelch-repeat protein At1g57790-like isoform X1 [Macadamia integrifolia]|uniref:F-box/kelch-repeat protein At1g57790-like isoform X1 n=1 Tax=Macadamia integrifolia TaxID=60698 RepID=UPI001C4F91F9|nr:F-box/kelch-repeat protein At1g57790-like isoform X1 [Macadamia integrifolia]
MTGRIRTNETEKPVRVDKLRPWSELPTELLEIIVSCLCDEDNVRLSCVCKNFRSFRAVNQSPWLMFSPAIGGRKGYIIKFFDPSQGKFYFDENIKLSNTFFQCSKDGWVLFSILVAKLFFFNPFTKSRINLPFHGGLPNWLIGYKFALSCVPTSPNSIVFAIGNTDLHGQGVCICICHPGDADWTILKYQNTDGALFKCGDGPVFCNGLFYCLSEFSDNLVGTFDPQNHTWSILPVPSPNIPFLSLDQRRAKHLVESKGKLLLVCISYPENPIVFRLDLTKMKWVEMDSLNGVTVFVSSLSSVSATDVPNVSRNSIYFSKNRFRGKSSYFYSLDDCKYHPAKQWHEARKIPKAGWVQPPKMTHPLFEEL